MNDKTTYHSQAHQDQFVHSLLGDSGTFIDCAAGHPIYINNTYTLEQKGWTGLMVDIEPKYKELSDKIRKSKYLVADALKIDWEKEIDECFGFTNEETKLIDYFSFDLDDVGLEAFKRFPWKSYTFKILTVENDLYRLGLEPLQVMRKIMFENGYEIGVPYVEYDHNIYEDWFVNPKYISKEKLDEVKKKMNIK